MRNLLGRKWAMETRNTPYRLPDTIGLEKEMVGTFILDVDYCTSRIRISSCSFKKTGIRWKTSTRSKLPRFFNANYALIGEEKPSVHELKIYAQNRNGKHVHTERLVIEERFSLLVSTTARKPPPDDIII
jgi:hypothetical protein